MSVMGVQSGMLWGLMRSQEGGLTHGEVVLALRRHGVRVRLQREGCPPDVGGVHRLLRQRRAPEGGLREGRGRRLHRHAKLPAQHSAVVSA